METLFLKDVENSYIGKCVYLQNDVILDKSCPWSEIIPIGVKVQIMQREGFNIYCRIIDVPLEIIEYDYEELLQEYEDYIEDGYYEVDLTEMFIDYVLNGNSIFKMNIDDLCDEDPYVTTPKEFTTLLL